MNEVPTCTRCLYNTNHPLGLVIDADGVCSGCRIHEEKNNLDWNYRYRRLTKIVKPYKSKNKKAYDCIIPVSGGNDSYFMVHVAKNLLKLNPLLVSYNKYFNTPLGIWNLSNLRIKFDCDILVKNVNPKTVKKITKHTLHELGSIYWHCLAGQQVFAIETAINYGVPLIIWGAHQGLEQVGMFSHEHEVEMTRRYRKDHDVLKHEAEDLINLFGTLNEEDICQYSYPSNYDMEKVGVRGIYLGNFIRWDPVDQHRLMIELYNYKSSHFNRTFDTYDHVDCYNYLDLHDLIKYYKHGYTKVLDHACREIRHKRISRETGISLVNHFQEKPIKFSKMFCKWLGINDRGLKFVLDNHRNKEIWTRKIDKKWVLRKQSFSTQTSKNFKKDETSKFFISNSNLNMGVKAQYITVGKGFP